MLRVKLKEIMIDDEEDSCLMSISVNGKDIIVEHCWFDFSGDRPKAVDFDKYWKYIGKDILCNLYLVGRYMDDDEFNLEKLGPIYIEEGLNGFGMIEGLRVRVMEKRAEDEALVYVEEVGANFVAQLDPADGYNGYHSQKKCLNDYEVGETVMIAEATMLIYDITPISEEKETEAD